MDGAQDEHPGARSRMIRRTFLAVYISLSILATAAAVFLNTASLGQVRRLLPGYPGFISVGMYMPLAPVSFLHALGASGLVLVSALAMTLTAVLWRSKHVAARRLAVVGASMHLGFLAFAILCFGFCMFRIWRILQLYT